MFGAEVLERSMQELSSKGYIELLRHFPEAEDSPPDLARSTRQPPLTVPGPPPAVAAPLLEEPAALAEAAALREPEAGVSHRNRNILVALGLGILCGLGLILFALGAVKPKPGPQTVASEAAATPESVPEPTASAPAASPDAVAAAGAWVAPAQPLAAAPPPQAGAVATTPPSAPHAPTPAPAAAPPPASARAVVPSKAAHAAGATVSLAPVPPVRPDLGVAIPLHVRTQVAPQLPKSARDKGVKSGHVAVVLHVDPQGKVQRVELVEAKPPEAYDAAMEQAFSQWTFDPPGVWGRMSVDIDIVPPHG
jgi:TonB family protein